MRLQTAVALRHVCRDNTVLHENNSGEPDPEGVLGRCLQEAMSQLQGSRR